MDIRKQRKKLNDIYIMKMTIKKSTRPEKKYMAIFTEKGKRSKTSHFGHAGSVQPVTNNRNRLPE